MAALKSALRAVREVALGLATYRRGVTRNVNGLALRVDSRSRNLFPSSYDAGATATFQDFAREGDTCWNIGANVGLHTLQLLSLVGPAGCVVAFEPNPAAAKLLERNVKLNGYSASVDIRRVAVGQHSGSVEFHVSGVDGMGRPERPNPLLPRTRRIQVPVTTLDDILTRQRVPPSCVVIDIEGWEIGALLGGRSILRLEPLPLIVVELHPDAWSWSGHSREQLEALLSSHGLDVLPLSGQRDVLREHGQARIARDETPNSSLLN